jgi:serine phosphatase RsbU (regulator of sigma subunit)
LPCSTGTSTSSGSTKPKLVLYTDGVIEARRDGELFGEERLERIVIEADMPVEELPLSVLEEVLAFSGGTLNDDVAVLALSLAGDPDDRRP